MPKNNPFGYYSSKERVMARAKKKKKKKKETPRSKFIRNMK